MRAASNSHASQREAAFKSEPSDLFRFFILILGWKWCRDEFFSTRPCTICLFQYLLPQTGQFDRDIPVAALICIALLGALLCDMNHSQSGKWNTAALLSQVLGTHWSPQ